MWEPSSIALYEKYIKLVPDLEVDWDRESEQPLLDMIKINDKEIKLINHKKCATTGLFGGNLFMSIANHIAMILLGLDTL